MQTATESGQIEKLGLFEFFQEFFNRGRGSNWHMISSKVKIDHAFMLKKYLAIKYPEFIQVFNRISSPATIDAIRLTLVTADSKKSPGWMYLYTKANKAGSVTKDVTAQLQKYSKETIQHFWEKHELSEGDFNQYLEFFYDDAIKQLDELENQLNKKAKTKKR